MTRADYWAGRLIQWLPFTIIANYLVLTCFFISNVQNRASQIFSTTGNCIQVQDRCLYINCESGAIKWVLLRPLWFSIFIIQVTHYLLYFVETEIKAAKSAGAYDVGITTMICLGDLLNFWANRVNFASEVLSPVASRQSPYNPNIPSPS